MIHEKFTIAIDGYSSCGKSTLAKALAQDLNFLYVDSGAMYRAVTYYFLKNNIDLNNSEEVSRALSEIKIDLHHKNNQLIVLLNGEDISAAIRAMRISENVSAVSSIKAVRISMVKQQQALADRQHIIMDGRDIGTIVFPNAQLKIFMTAETKIRAQRRYDELISSHQEVSLEEVLNNIESRDLQDTTREESPLRRADDALLLDNSHMNQQEQLNFVKNELFKRYPQLAPGVSKHS